MMNGEIHKSGTGVTEKKKQQILVPHDFSDACNCAVSYGAILAQIFRCELTLVHVLTPANIKPHGDASQADQHARNKLAGMAVQTQKQAGIPTNAYVFQGKPHVIIRQIIERINAIILVGGLNTVNRNASQFFTSRNIVKDFRELRIPILVVQNKLPEAGVFRHIILPIDFTRESKEKAAWAGYFSKLHRSVITVVHTEYKDGFFAAQLRNNLILVRKLFDSLNTVYEMHRAEKVNYGVDRYGVSYAKMREAGMIIIMARKEWGIDDFLIGPPEKRIITNEDQLPVMLINPRDDLYVPCV